MKRWGWLLAVTACFTSVHAAEPTLNWDAMIHLDAEDLAEEGIAEHYVQDVLPTLRQYVAQPLEVSEQLDNDAAIYNVSAGGQQYAISSPQISEADSWGRATWAFFDIVNRQFSASDYRFYAFYNGNDLCGMFLTRQAYQHYVDGLSRMSRKTEIPYIPTAQAPWYGQPH